METHSSCNPIVEQPLARSTPPSQLNLYGSYLLQLAHLVLVVHLLNAHLAACITQCPFERRPINIRGGRETSPSPLSGLESLLLRRYHRRRQLSRSLRCVSPSASSHSTRVYIRCIEETTASYPHLLHLIRQTRTFAVRHAVLHISGVIDR